MTFPTSFPKASVPRFTQSLQRSTLFPLGMDAVFVRTIRRRRAVRGGNLIQAVAGGRGRTSSNTSKIGVLPK